MFCPKCGAELPDGKTRFCVKCGEPAAYPGKQTDHAEYPKAPGAGRAAAVLLCLLLIAGGSAGGIYYIAKHGIDLSPPPAKTASVSTAAAPTETSAEPAETSSAPETETQTGTKSSSRTTSRTDDSSSLPETSASAGSESVDRRFDFVTPAGKETYVSVHFNRSAYDTYHSYPRYYQPDEFIYYINNTVNKAVLKAMTDAMAEHAKEQGYTKKELAYMAIRLVQSIKYVTDSESSGKEDYPKYPIETVYEMEGDCEDLSILLVGLLRELGFETCFVVLTDHVGVGIRLDDAENGTYFEYNGIKYYYVETTAEGWNIGAYPEELKTDAHLYFVK